MANHSVLKSQFHVDSFDYLRVMATVCVVFMHTAAERLRSTVDFQWELLNVCTSFSFTAVPLFLMMSGFLLCSNQKTTNISFLLRKRLPRLIVPLASWTAAAALQLLTARKTLSVRAFLSMIIGTFHAPLLIHFWYMYLMIVLYVLSPLLYGAVHSLDRNGRRYLLALIGLVTVHAMLTAVLPDQFDKFLAFDLVDNLKIYNGHLATFLLGYYLGSVQRRIPNRVLVPSAAALWAVVSFGTHVLTVQNGEYTSAFQSQSTGFEVLLAACLFLLFRFNAKPSRFFRAVPIVPLCLPIYLMHGLVLTQFHIMNLYPLRFQGICKMTALNVVICYFAAKTAATIPPLCFPLTGMSFQDACRSCNWVYTFHNIRTCIHKR